MGVFFLINCLLYGTAIYLKLSVWLILLLPIIAGIIISDIRSYTIPDFLTVMIVIIRILNLSDYRMTLNAIFNGLMVSIPIYVLSLLMNRLTKQESIGMGDIKLYFALSLYLDAYHDLFAVTLSCVYGLIGMTLLRKRRIAFGPCICLAYLTVLIYCDLQVQSKIIYPII